MKYSQIPLKLNTQRFSSIYLINLLSIFFRELDQSRDPQQQNKKK